MASNKQRKAASALQARQAVRAEAERAKQEAEAKVRKQRLIVASGVLGALIVFVVLVVVIATHGSKGPDLASVSSRPTGASSTGGIVIGKGGVAGGEASEGADVVTVDIYSDYMCPYCGSLETAISEKLGKMVDEGQIRLVLHPLAVLDYLSEGTNYSSRAANAAMTVASLSPDNFLAFHHALFEGQPEEGTEGLTDEQIATIATDADVPTQVVAAFSESTYQEWVEASTSQAAKDGVTGTPMVYMSLGDGERQSWTKWGTGAIGQAVAAVKEGRTPDEGTP